MTTIGLIRHGTTDWNVTGRLQGQNDIPLNEAGRWQAVRLAERLRRERWDAIASSDLARARETADIVAEAAGIGPVRLEAGLRERTHGRLDGTTLEERIAAWGPDWKELDHGVESDELLFARGYACIEKLLREFEGRRLLVVSHGAFIGVVMERLLGPRMPDGLLRNTSVSILERTNDGWLCPLYNCTSHLPA
ncbi:histidine phosphatase family protein [Paenibacillus flagellatus]|uniref:Histidine phosphatase family protein n=1 Tax=Paenibacillus flagellatus TaxID=2211139 RepID=A0A2V5KA22_9BACL|nr:histidine phosphatase family protein [Paenibacillus flagellatus]PYI54904.1 histidine phosphatase family protein [Paenibacillus flagellatus]